MKIQNWNDYKIAIYGGSFNPIHIGHLITGLKVIENLGYDKILFIPLNIPSHKNVTCSINSKHRLKMVKLAINGINEFIYSDIEIKRGGLSYTIDTVKQLIKEYKYDKKFGVIFGDDLLDGLNSWKDIDELNEISQLICLFRNQDKITESRYNIKWVNNMIINVSSTMIRERVKKGLKINFFVTERVNDYIIKKQLYRIEE